MSKKSLDNDEIIMSNEKITIAKSDNKLEAYIKFTAPVNGGSVLSSTDIKKAIDNSDIKYGILEGLIETLVVKREYNHEYLLAVGLASVNSENSYLKFHFNIENKTLKPKLLENGRVDYQNLNLIEMANKGDVLVSIVESSEGVDGMNVCGKPIKHIKGKPAPNLPKGTNVSISKDGKSLIADVTGQINYINKKVNMSSILNINGDVDNTTGNIEFNGSIVISGAVRSGFSVKASGNIEIFGVVEASDIKSNGHIFLSSGIQGAGKANIEADGNIFCKYVESAKLVSRGDITSECIIHSTVECFGKLQLIGNKGALLGGVISARDSIVAKEIGSPMGTITEIKVGNDPSLLLKYNEVVGELQNTKNEYNKMNQIIEMLEKIRKSGELSIDKKSQYVKALHTKNFLITKQEELEKELTNTISYMNTNSGEVIANFIIYSGVNVLIGNALMYVRDDIYKSRLVNINGRVIVVNV